MTSETRSRSFSWHDPAEAAAYGRQQSGHDYLHAIATGKLPQPPLSAALGFYLTQVEPGRVVFDAQIEEFHYNPIGTVHGGVVATLIDSASGCAVYSRLEVGVAWTTVDLRTEFFRPLSVTTGAVRCIGTAVRVGRRVAVGDAELVDDTGKVYARGTCTCLVIRPS